MIGLTRSARLSTRPPFKFVNLFKGVKMSASAMGPQIPLIATIPHSGERIPPEAPWLEPLPETLLMYDVDRYVDRLYEPTLRRLEIPFVKTDWHRYACDLNRLEDDTDEDSVANSAHPRGTFPRGLHWSITTEGERLMPAPISQEAHRAIIARCFSPFHERVRSELAKYRDAGARATYHLDLHSMPSVGTREHRDPGKRRADVVVSDCDGRSASSDFKDAVIKAYQDAGFRVAYNWPYKGGRLTETYGQPKQNQHAIQAELNRGLYMDEKTKRLRDDLLEPVRQALEGAISSIHAWAGRAE